MTVDLGFIEKCDPWRLESRFFPSKVGGRPAWLDLKDIPKKQDLECEHCGDSCIFLCQVYAPYEEDDSAFHRTIYVFICKNPGCCKINQNGNIKVLRSQLERHNSFYPSEPPIEEEEWGIDIKVENWVKTCCICGILAPSHCSKCKMTNYCCRNHQIYHWKHGHKNLCGDDVVTTNTFLFPEYELVIETEDVSENNKDCNEIEEKELQKYQEMVQNGEAGTLQQDDVSDDLSKMANGIEDETFSIFRSRIAKYPEQVLRYERGGNVLHISSKSKVEEIPNCSVCNSERHFEFQIMPQLLNFLNSKDAIHCLDWGLLAIFTCKKSCKPKNGYASEYVWKQDIIDDTVENKENN